MIKIILLILYILIVYFTLNKYISCRVSSFCRQQSIVSSNGNIHIWHMREGFVRPPFSYQSNCYLNFFRVKIWKLFINYLLLLHASIMWAGKPAIFSLKNILVNRLTSGVSCLLVPSTCDMRVSQAEDSSNQMERETSDVYHLYRFQQDIITIMNLNDYKIRWTVWVGKPMFD